MRVGNKIKVSRSSDQAARLNLDWEVLQRVAGLDLTERVDDATLIGGGGAYSDLAWSWLKSTETSGLPMKVAVKKLRFHCTDVDIKRLFEKEIYVWSKLQHPNILRMLGYAFEHESGCPLLISPWMERGTAWKYVNENVGDSVLCLILGIARGLQYMHSRGVVHSDIKSGNILVSSSNPPEAIICDFGTARMSDPSLSLARLSEGVKGTFRWMAPELFDFGGSYSKESDIWAFGMTVYELVMRQRPYAQFHGPEILILDNILRGVLPELPQSLLSEPEYFGCLKKLCRDCWNHEASSRISADGILDILRPFEQRKVCPGHNSEMLPGTYQDPVPGLLVKNFRGFPRQKQVYCAKFSPDGERIAIGAGRTVRIYHIKSSNCEWVLDHGLAEQGGDNRVKNLCFNHDPTVIATGATDKKLRIWERDRVEEEWELPHQTVSLAFSAYGRFLAYGLADGSAYLLKYAYSGNSVPFKIDDTCSPNIGIVFSPSTHFLATGSCDGIVRIWKEQGQHWTFMRELDIHSSTMDSITFVSDTKIIVSSGRAIKKLEVNGMESEVINAGEDFCGHADDITSIAVSHDGKWIVSGSKDKIVRMWAQESGQLARTLTEHEHTVVSVDFNPKGGNFATVDESGQIIIWSYETR